MKEKQLYFFHFFCTLFLIVGLGCGSETVETTETTNCPAGEVEFKTDGETSCLAQCFVDGTCDENNARVPDMGSSTSPINNTSNNNGTVSNNATTAGGETTPKSIVVDKNLNDQEFCEAIFDKYLKNCLDTECNLNPETEVRFAEIYAEQVEICLTSRNKSTHQRYYDSLANARTCGAFRLDYCLGRELGDQCGCVPTNSGDPCITASQCQGDSLPTCIGSNQGFPGGYCTSRCANGRTTAERSTLYHGDPNCGEGNICTIRATANGNATTSCRAGCTSQSECREGYECVFAGTQVGIEEFEGVFVRYCSPIQPPASCQTLTDCSNRAPCINGSCHPNAVYQCTEPPLNGETKGSDENCVNNGGSCEFINGKTFCIVP